MDEEHDDLALGFMLDAFATEYHHPGQRVMTAVVDDLAAHRGPGQRKALWRSLLFAGFRFGAVDLQDRDGARHGLSPWPAAATSTRRCSTAWSSTWRPAAGCSARAAARA